jgi:photosystem II stability/assembly factor-like uncharacterized protein
MQDPLTSIAATPDIVYAIAVSPSFRKDGICFAARRSGLFRSDDRGLTWHSAYKSLRLQAALPTATVALSPDFGRDGTVFAGVAGGVLRSTDGGAGWQVVTLPTPPPHVTSLLVSPDYARDGTVLGGTLEDGVLRSGDRGRNWVAWNFGLLDLNTLAMSISSDYAADETVFVGTESGIFRSINGGRAWREVAFPVEFAPVLSLALSPNYSVDGTLLAGTEAHGLFVSRDRGGSWDPSAEGTAQGAVNGLVVSAGSSGALHILALLGHGVLLSRDGGQAYEDCGVAPETDEGFTTAAAPSGLEEGALLLIGQTDGRVQSVTVP